MSLQRVAAVNRIIDNFLRAQIAVQEVIANDSQANVDSAVAAGLSTGLLQFKITYSVDGESYDWTAWQQFIADSIEKWLKIASVLSGPYDVRSRAR